MNNRPVEQALATLLPTHANDLPPELLSLAVSLVAQSRSFSSSLKPEEEIARPYACAEIACKRLSRVFKLPPLLGHPPCPPRVYKKLFAFLDRSLSPKTSDSVSRTPSRKESAPSTPKKGLSNGARTPSKSTTAALPPSVAHTPSKSSALTRTVNGRPKAKPRRQAAKPLPRATNGVSTSTIIPDAPAWVMTAIRTVCKTLSTPAPRTTAWSRPPISKTLPPHIFAGVSSILYFSSQLSSSGATSDNAELDGETSHFLDSVLSTQQEQNDDGNTDPPNDNFKDLVYALIVAIYFIVLARRRNPSTTSTSNESADAGEAKRMDDKTFSEMRQVALTSLGLFSTERRHRRDVEHWIALIMGMGWSAGREWFENIPQAGDIDGDDDREGHISDSGVYDEHNDGLGSGKQKLLKRNREGVGAGLARRSNKDGASRGGLLPGLGTMMEDRVDWLSDERREDYLEWKADIMERIDSMRRAMVS